MATLAHFTINSISSALNFLPLKVRNILVTGGGLRNNFLMKNLKEKLDINFIEEKDVNINSDFIESEMIAFLSARSLYKLPITFPQTTGVQEATIGGKIYYYK